MLCFNDVDPDDDASLPPPTASPVHTTAPSPRKRSADSACDPVSLPVVPGGPIEGVDYDPFTQLKAAKTMRLHEASSVDTGAMGTFSVRGDKWNGANVLCKRLPDDAVVNKHVTYTSTHCTRVLYHKAAYYGVQLAHPDRPMVEKSIEDVTYDPTSVLTRASDKQPSGIAGSFDALSLGSSTATPRPPVPAGSTAARQETSGHSGVSTLPVTGGTESPSSSGDRCRATLLSSCSGPSTPSAAWTRRRSTCVCSRDRTDTTT
jgi:hypothetical protein